MIVGGLLPFPAVTAAPVLAGAWLTALILAYFPTSTLASSPSVKPALAGPVVEKRRVAV
jgi:hypothetical protein